MLDQALLILNRSSATGHSSDDTAAILRAYKQHFAFAQRRVSIVTSHAEVCAAAGAFQESCDTSGVILSGGGAGTLRAVVEGLCAKHGRLPDPDHICVAPLRLGSGNVLAKTFGVSKDPDQAMAIAARNVIARQIDLCSVMRCDVDGRTKFAMTLIGLGQFGRIPRDLAGWHQRFPRLRSGIARVLGVERLTQVEYRIFTAARGLQCALWPRQMETVEIETRRGCSRVGLFAGAVANFAVPGLPFTPSHGPEELALSGFILCDSVVSPLGILRDRNRIVRTFQVTPGHPVTIRLVSPKPTPFFLDEDPMSFCHTLQIGIAGTLGIVPGTVCEQFENSSVHLESEAHHVVTHLHTWN